MVFECNIPQEILGDITSPLAVHALSPHIHQKDRPGVGAALIKNENLVDTPSLEDSIDPLPEHSTLKKGYRFYNAAMTPDKTDRCRLYVRDIRPDEKPADKITVNHHKFKDGRVATTIKNAKKVYWIETGHDIKGPDDPTTWLFINFDIHSDDCEIQQEIVERVLCSFHYFRSGSLDGAIGDKKKRNTRLEIFMDSGGFQFASSKTTYIDLNELAKVYKRHATRALTLDIPPTDDDLLNPEIMKVLAIAQRENTEKILSKLPKGFLLYNTIHGLDYEAQLDWLEIVRNLAISNYAIPLRMRYNQFFSFIPIIAHLIFNEKAESIHLLGVAFERIIPLLCVIGKYIAISSDANSILKNTYEFHKYLYYTGDGRIHEYPIGQKNGIFDYSKTGITSPCGCPVCRHIPLFEIHQFDEKYRTVPMLLLHNFWHFEKFIAHWNNIIASKSIEEAAEIYGATFANRNLDPEDLKRLMLNVDCYLKIASEKGTEVAYDTFWTYFEDDDAGEDETEVEYMSALDWEIDHEFKSNLHLAKRYLPDHILEKYADLFSETARKLKVNDGLKGQKSVGQQRIANEANDESFLLYTYLRGHEGLSQRFGLDIVKFWGCLREILYNSSNRRCVLNPEHNVDVTEVKVDESLTIATISCDICGYSLKFDIETE